MIKRILNIDKIIARKSLFLFGPRMTGKTTYLKQKYADALFIDLLDLDTLRTLQVTPKSLHDWITKHKKSNLVIVDEIQKLPELLNEIHRIIELKKEVRFILTGSSARKLKKLGVNLLGGRASEIHMKPLTLFEIKDHEFSWQDALRVGLLPSIVTSPEPRLDLKDYINLYLQREIKEEALVKNFLNFSRFIDFAAHANTELLNFTSLGSDAQIAPRTVQDYFSILEDTLLGEKLPPFNSAKRKNITTSKFYFFDNGVVNYLTSHLNLKKGSPEFGKAFEQLVFCELSAFKSYNFQTQIDLYFWRTHSQLEVDFILVVEEKIFAIEVKATSQPRLKDFGGLRSFKDEFPEAKLLMVTPTSHSAISNDIEVLSILDFVNWLWTIK
jgi:predicted AAA+ superfamily ATPase